MSVERSVDRDLFGDVVGPSSAVPRHRRNEAVFRQSSLMGVVVIDPLCAISEGSGPWLLKKGLECLDLSPLLGTYEKYGGVAFHPRLLLGILLLGFSEGITSARELARRCRRDIAYQFISEGICPDHSTITRFRRRLIYTEKELWKSVHKALRSQDGYQKPSRIGIDGTKISSAGAPVKISKAELEQASGPVIASSDPDAVHLRGPHSRLFGYNAQIVVDLDSGYILATEVTTHKSDRDLLVPMLEKSIEVLGYVPDQVVADKGYDFGESYQRCEELGVQAIVPPQSSPEEFWSADELGRVMCPMGEEPSKQRVTNERGRKVVVHSVPESTCRKCQFFNECIGSARRRTLTAPVGVDISLRILSAQRARSPDGRQALRDRMSRLEAFFGRMKWNKRIVRFRLRGLAGARVEFSLVGLSEAVLNLGGTLQRLLHAIFQLLRVESCAAVAKL